MVSLPATVLWLVSVSASAQTIPNPSFEADTFSVFPGYVSANAPITGWTGAPANRIGLNPGGGSPFANNGAIPSGSQVAFIQANVDDPATPTYLSTTLSGLTVGTTYKLTFRANARTGNTPNINVFIDDVAILLPGGPDGLSTAAVGASNPYWYIACEFQATAASQVLKIVNDATGDQTLLIDDFQIAPSAGKWSVQAWTGDADSGVDSSFFYTHAFNFGSSAGAAINGVNFTGIPGTAPSVPGQFSTTYLGAGPVGDTTIFVADNSAILAGNFVYGGDVPAGLYQSISLQGLTPGTEYIISIFSVAWENPAVGSRWATFSVGEDRLTINQDQFLNDNGIKISYRYTADASGNMTIKFAPLVPANVSFHVYAFCNREAVSQFKIPVITAQPKSQVVSPDLPVTFAVAAAGVPPPEFYWRFKGTPITDATNTTYVVPAATLAEAGLYDVVVSNRAGFVISQPARLTVGIPMINPSFEVDAFGTWPGYVSGNFPITGWASLGNHGLNPVTGGASPFADNGAIPQGAQVAFLQGDGALSQTVSGLVVGAQYYVHYLENARSVVTVPALELKFGGQTVLQSHSVPPVGGGNSYHEMFSDVFTASATDLELAFVKSSPQGGDCTALVDNVAIIPVPSGTPPSVGVQPQSTTVYVGQPASFWVTAQGSLPLSLQWCLNSVPISNETNANFLRTSVKLADEGNYTLVVTNISGSSTSLVARLSLLEAIPSLHNTGLDASSQPLPAGTIAPFWTIPVNPDNLSSNAIVANEGWPIASGVWMLNTATSKWIGPRATVADPDIATGDYVYRTTFDLTGRDTNTVIINGGWASDNNGTAVFLNGATVAVPLSTSFGGFTSFTLGTNNATFLPGTNVLEFGINNAGAGPTALRVEFTKTSARTLPGVPAGIAGQPVGANLVEGDNFTLSVSATGTLPLGYQWKKNGTDLSGKTADTLLLSQVTTNDSGSYSVLVSNFWGTALSSNAVVNVIYRPLPGIFGTGLKADGQLLDDGQVDPHYILAASGDPSVPGPDAITISNAWPIQAGVWLPNGPGSRWIGPQADQSTAAGNAGGDYVYQTTVNLAGYDVSRVSLVGGWAVDNEGTDILVNGASSGSKCLGFGSLTPFVITNNLVAGINTLDFKVSNYTNDLVLPNPTGLRVDLKALLNIQSAARPTLQILKSGSSVAISWAPPTAGLILQSANDILGPWIEITNAPNPYVVPATNSHSFYRLTQ